MSDALNSLIHHLSSSQRILAIVGAGLSRPSGVPTFREDPAFWGHRIEDVATASAFNKDPVAIWSNYERMRQIAQIAKPNPGHEALARFAHAKEGFLTISQNIDELLLAAGHPGDQLISLHGSLFNVACTNELCLFTSRNTTGSPIVPRMFLDSWDTREISVSLPDIKREHIPHCPNCRTGRLRPGVVMFGERLVHGDLTQIDGWFSESAKVDLVLVIGTERTPFLYEAQQLGAHTAVFNVFDDPDDLKIEWEDDCWFVNGCASQTLPWILGQASKKP